MLAALFETRFAKYWANLLRFDFGVSLVTKQPVMTTLLGKLKYSLSLSVLSLILAYLIAIPLGIYMIACVWIFVGTLVGFNRVGRSATVGERLRPAAALLVQALPLMVAFFILFPRTTGPLPFPRPAVRFLYWPISTTDRLSSGARRWKPSSSSRSTLSPPPLSR